MKQRGLAPILIILLLTAAVGGYFLYQKQVKPATAPQITAQSSPSPKDETVNWKTYTIQKVLFSMKYPPNWTVTEKKFNESEEEIIFSGSEGKISFKIGTGFGGGCPIPITIKISGQELQGCQTENEQRISFGKETNTSFNAGNGDGAMAKLNIQVDADIASPVQSNKTTILNILSTFKFLDSTIDVPRDVSENGQEYFVFKDIKLKIQRVKEGEYCEGRFNASQRTYQKCASGLKCQFTQGSAQDAPGICVKE